MKNASIPVLATGSNIWNLLFDKKLFTRTGFGRGLDLKTLDDAIFSKLNKDLNKTDWRFFVSNNIA
jgi:hypothetical protein